MGRPAIVYIDEFLWVELARQYTGPPDSVPDVVRALLSAVELGDVVCPLSAAHVIETNRRTDLRSRRDVITTFIAFSRGWFIAPVSALAPQEIRRSVASLFGTPGPGPITAVARGLPFAFGRSGHLHEDLEMGVDESTTFEAMLDDPAALFHLLGGSNNDYIEPTRSAIMEHARKAASREEQNRGAQKRFAEAERKRAYAATLTIALQEELSAALHAVGRTMADLLAIGSDDLMMFWASVPTANVEMELVTARNKQWPRQIKSNDIADIDFLSVAIPYCDLVLTEAFWGQLTSQTGVAEKYGTAIGANLAALSNFLKRRNHQARD